MKFALFSIFLTLALALPIHPWWVDVPAPAPAEPVATVLFGGDMMFDRYIRQVSDTVSGDYVFSCVDHILATADLVVANLEGPITDHPSRSMGTVAGIPDNYIFTFHPSTATTLARHGIAMVNIGNNHILNFGAEGRHVTEAYLTEADVQFFDESHVATTTVNGVPLAFITYNEFDPAVEHSNILENMRISRERGYLPIVYTHWGEEYQPATEEQKALARRFIDGGAEMVIGSHPHIVQEHELYLGKHIYYSLGNFIFDQYFSEDVRRGLLIKVLFSSTGVTGVEEIPIELTPDGRTCQVQVQ